MRDGYWQQTVCGGCGSATDAHAMGCEGGGYVTREQLRAESIRRGHLNAQHIGAPAVITDDCPNCQRYGETGAVDYCEGCRQWDLRVEFTDADPDNVHGSLWLCEPCRARVERERAAKAGGS